MSVIANTTVISNFASIGQLELLAQMIRHGFRSPVLDLAQLL